MNFLKGVAESALQDAAMDKWNEIAAAKFQTKDPYRYETPEGKSKKLKLPEGATKKDQKMWKWVQRRAWIDDKCFMGCYPIDCGIGLGPIVVAIPVIGPLLMYAVHARLTTRAGQYWHLDAKTVAKLQANIFFDFLITLPPVIGSFLSWMNGCSTRNAAIIYNQVSKKMVKENSNGIGAGNFGNSQRPPPPVKNQNASKDPHKAEYKNHGTTNGTTNGNLSNRLDADNDGQMANKSHFKSNYTQRTTPPVSQASNPMLLQNTQPRRVPPIPHLPEDQQPPKIPPRVNH